MSNKAVKVAAVAVVGFAISDISSMYLSEQIWWPITAKVYKDCYHGIRDDDDHTTEENLHYKNESDSLKTKVGRVVQHLIK